MDNSHILLHVSDAQLILDQEIEVQEENEIEMDQDRSVPDQVMIEDPGQGTDEHLQKLEVQRSFHDTIGNIDVNGSGQLQYIFPIALPPGVRNVGPQINLVYASGTGTGIAGFGWNISGLTSISRIGKLAEDGLRNEPISFDLTDGYSFNGQLLLLKSGEYGKDGAEYVTEKYSNIRIRSIGINSNSTGPEYFEINFEDGSQAWYGRSSDSRTILEYNLTQWRDVNGNYISYSYVQNDNVAVISQIDWGGNEAVGTAHFNNIMFSYSTREAMEISYVNGEEFIQRNILSGIGVHCKGNLFKAYNIEHGMYLEGHNYQFINSITELNTNGEPANPVTFEYGFNDNSPTDAQWKRTYTSTDTSSDILYGDFTGDGKIDILKYSEAYSECTEYEEIYNEGSQSPSDPEYETGYWETVCMNYESRPAGIYLSASVFDDEKPQQVHVGTMVTKEQLKDAVVLNIINSSGILLPNQGFTIYETPFSSTSPQIRRKDLVIKVFSVGHENGQMELKQELTRTVPADDYDRTENRRPIGSDTFTYWADTDIIEVKEFDLNGDGASELVYVLRDTQNWIEDDGGVRPDPRTEISYRYLVVSPSIPESGLWYQEIYLGSSTENFFGTKMYQGDFNGDGIIDFLRMDFSGNAVLKEIRQDARGRFYDHDTFFDGPSFLGLWEKAIVGDFTGDGKTDLLVPNAIDDRLWRLYISTGNGFREQEVEDFVLYKENLDFTGSTHSRHIQRNYFARDLDRDGKADLISFYSHVHHDYGSNTFSTKFIIIYHENLGYDKTGKIVFRQKNIDGSTVKPVIPDYMPPYKMDWYPEQYDRYRTDVESYAFSNKGAHFSPIIGDFRVNSSNQDILIFQPGTLIKYAHYSIVEKGNITNINQGGITTGVKYLELDPVKNEGFYGPVKPERYPYVELGQLPRSLAVSQLDQEGRVQDFKYRGFLANITGKGMVGFRKTARSSWYSYGLESTKIWTVSEFSPEFDGMPIKEWSVHTLSDDQLIFPEIFSENISGLLSYKELEYDISMSNLDVKAIVPSKTTSKDILKDTTIINTITYDEFFLPRTVFDSLNGDFSIKETNYEYENNPLGIGSDYFIGRAISMIEVKKAYNDEIRTNEEYIYQNRLLSEIKSFDRRGQVWKSEHYTYDGFGNMTEKRTSSNEDGIVREEGSVYDGLGRFTIFRIDNLGLSTELSYNDHGQVIKEKDPFGNTIDHVYDSWGKLTSSISSLKGTSTFTYEKLIDGGNKTTNSNFDGSTKEIFSDKWGKNYRVRSRGFNKEGYIIKGDDGNDIEIPKAENTYINKDIQYDILGRQIGESEPYFDNETPYWNTISYDDSAYPPIITAISFTGKMMLTKQEGRKQISEELNGNLRKKTQTFDALGNIESSQDVGGTINFSYNADSQQIRSQIGDNIITTEYDHWGRRSKFHDPSNGQYSYAYNSANELIKQISPLGYKEYTYSSNGLLAMEKEKSNEPGLTNKTIECAYNAFGQLTERKGTSNGQEFKVNLQYDAHGRIIGERESLFDRVFERKNIIYDGNSRIGSYERSIVSEGITTQVDLEHKYDDWTGGLHKIIDRSGQKILWQILDVKASGEILHSRLGVTEVNNIFDDNGYLKESKHTSQSGSILNNKYEFDGIKNELKIRERFGSLAITESFRYDNHNRLVEWTNIKDSGTSFNSYDPLGRITENENLGNFYYDNEGKIYQNTRIKLNSIGKQYYSLENKLDIEYNENNDPTLIRGKQEDVSFGYGLNSQRQMMTFGGKISQDFDVAEGGWQGEFTKYLSADGNLEVVRNNITGEEKHIIYIGGSPYESNSVLVKDFQDTIGSYYFLHKDYLGSILAISNKEGLLVEQRHFDAWGNFTHGTMDILDRGYTSHEHIPSVGIVHMNGRLYDPNLRRFLNADANIQDEFNSLNYNKYAYVLCNPLMYNDPTGEFFFAALGLAAIFKAIFIGAAIGLASYTLSLAVTGNLKSWNLGGALKATFFGAVSGAITFGIGQLFHTASLTFGNALLQAGAHGISQGILGLVQGDNFFSAMVAGALGSLGAAGWGRFMKGAGLGQFANSTLGIVSFGAIAGGIGAELSGGNFWQGAIVGGLVAGLNHALHKIDINGQKGNDGKVFRQKLKEKIDVTDPMLKTVEGRTALDEYLKMTLGQEADKILKGVGKSAGFIGNVSSFYVTGAEFYDGNISGLEFTFDIGTTATSIWVSTAIGGPAGFVGGVVAESVLKYVVKPIYKNYVKPYIVVPVQKRYNELWTGFYYELIGKIRMSY